MALPDNPYSLNGKTDPRTRYNSNSYSWSGVYYRDSRCKTRHIRHVQKWHLLRYSLSVYIWCYQTSTRYTLWSHHLATLAQSILSLVPSSTLREVREQDWRRIELSLQMVVVLRHTYWYNSPRSVAGVHSSYPSMDIQGLTIKNTPITADRIPIYDSESI